MEAIRTGRRVRRFTPAKGDYTLVRKILLSARAAPSAGNPCPGTLCTLPSLVK